jgi:hypothetical protein
VDDIGFILTSWIITLGSMSLLAFMTVRRARRLAEQIPDEAKPWL